MQCKSPLQLSTAKEKSKYSPNNVKIHSVTCISPHHNRIDYKENNLRDQETRIRHKTILQQDSPAPQYCQMTAGGTSQAQAACYKVGEKKTKFQRVHCPMADKHLGLC